VLDELCPMTQGEESFPPTEIESALDHVQHQAVEVVRRSSATAAAALDHLAQVLDPEERAALAADFAEPGVPVAVARADRDPSPVVEKPVVEMLIIRDVHVPMPVAEVAAAPAVEEVAPVTLKQREAIAPPPLPAAEKAPGTRGVESVEREIPPSHAGVDAPATLRAFDVDKHPDRPAQWQAVERSIWDLSPKSALLDAKPPMSWASETCISIDAQGCVNVWTLYKDGASWYALREWSNEHRNLLALTRRDLTIDKEAEVAVHIVLPLAEGKEQDNVASTLMRVHAKNLHLYRLRILQWNGKRGLVVVPIA